MDLKEIEQVENKKKMLRAIPRSVVAKNSPKEDFIEQCDPKKAKSF